jgi:HTH-type transcriptional regulator, transcriptional repressor of NAD biosynthesis genes
MDSLNSQKNVIRVCVVGAESTGTTTLARDLAEHYHTVWVPEYGRLYTERLRDQGLNIFTYEWKTEEFVHIAEQQHRDEDAAALKANGVLFCDTDALATCIWHQRYLGTWSKEVEEIANRRRYAIYFLTDCDIPFEFDGVRDGQHIRPWMTKRFSEELTKRGCSWVLVKGTREERSNSAIEQVNKLLAEQKLMHS